ncbi:hypothetical protein LCGC14_3060570 [marine sediment metagenome]|uniref:RNase H type-1 domain-containing protein n=1 Tax=marine sediment metagenome TaxID=412755 RepID=A0A0F8Z9R0_9ZZZZ
MKKSKKRKSKSRLKEKHGLNIWVDGGSLGASGPSVFAYIFKNSHGDIISKSSGYLGIVSSSIAEYLAIINALNSAEYFLHRDINVFSDCLSVVNHINKENPKKPVYFLELHRSVKKLINKFPSINFHHVSRNHPLIQKCHNLCSSCIKNLRISKVWPY